jgi:leucyl-tRNA synthetase
VPKDKPEPYKKRLSHGVILGSDGSRMSKSVGNVIVPDEMVNKYGADSTRTYMMFMGPFDATMAWNENSLVGVKRFLDRLYKYVTETAGKNGESEREALVSINKLIKLAGEEIVSFKFNTVVARLMETLNDLTRGGYKVTNEELKKIVLVLAPFAPFVAEELWNVLGGEFSVHNQSWPICDESMLITDTVVLSVQVNGKMRGTVEVKTDAGEETVKAEVAKQEKINKYLSEGEIKKVIYIKGKAISFVVK